MSNTLHPLFLFSIPSYGHHKPNIVKTTYMLLIVYSRFALSIITTGMHLHFESPQALLFLECYYETFFVLFELVIYQYFLSFFETYIAPDCSLITRNLLPCFKDNTIIHHTIFEFGAMDLSCCLQIEMFLPYYDLQ